MFKWFLVIFIVVALVYGGAVLYAYISQRKLQYFPTHRDADGAGDGIFRPWKTSQGAFLGYMRPCEKPRRAVLMFHGNGGEALDRGWLAELLPDRDVVLLLAEYPGYGALSGVPTEQSLYEAAEVCLKEARTRWKVPVTVLGESLGSAVACHLAARSDSNGKAVDRLSLISPFTSATEVAARHYSFLPVRLIHRDRMSNVQHLRSVKLPLHILHGTLDDVVPIEMAKELHENYSGGPKTLTALPGYGHNNISSAAVDSPFADGFRNFLRGN